MKRYLIAVLGGFSAGFLFIIMGDKLVDPTIPAFVAAYFAIYILVGCFLYAVYQPDSK